jgi:dihydroorotate dehydrogenase (fumarate)
MILETTYMGLKLKNPLIAGASPMTTTVDQVVKLEDQGAAAVVMHSLFEEQINHDVMALDHFLYSHNESFAEALDYLPETGNYNNIAAEQHLEELRQIKERLEIPVIASINGVSSGGWTNYVKRFEEAGADAIELNITYIPTDVDMDPRSVEQMYVDVVKDVKSATSLPFAVKMSPYFSAPAQMAASLVDAGAAGLVLFDNPVRIDIDLEELTTVQKANITDSTRLSETLRWSGILYKNVNASLCASTGVHHSYDVLKAIMSGVDAVQMASALLKYGEEHVATVLSQVRAWMEEKEYTSIEQMKGSISMVHTDNPAAYQRSSYMRALQTYRD